MEDGVDNGMIIYITLTAQIIAAGFSTEIFNYISHILTPLSKDAVKSFLTLF